MAIELIVLQRKSMKNAKPRMQNAKWNPGSPD
jgi:hypothetical protein